MIVSLFYKLKMLFFARNTIVFKAEKNDYVAQMAGHGNCQDIC